MNGRRTAAANVGRHVQVLRRGRGWSQEEFGCRVAEVLGVGAWRMRQTVSSGEKGRRAWTADEIAAAAEVFGVTPGRLFEAPPACGTCLGMPPVGFTCRACGAES